MSQILLPQRFLTQPQYPAPLRNPGFWRLVDIQGLPPMGTAASTITRTLKATAKQSVGRSGKCIDFVASGDWLSYGTNSALQLSTMTGLAVVEVPSSPSDIATIFNTNVAGSFARGFVIRVNADGTVLALMQDVIGLGQTTKTVRLGDVSTVAWSYNNVTGALRIAIDGTLESFTYADSSFVHGEAGRNQYYHNSTVQAKAHKQYLFALSASDRVSNAELVDWSLNPWSIFQAPDRSLFITASAPGGDGAGTAAGSATVSGVGASTAQSTGSVSGVSGVSGTGAAISKATGSISGQSTVSGTGSAVLESVGSASGSSTVSGVGISGTGSSGIASGNATATGVGASIAASSGVGNGAASVSGVGACFASTAGNASGSSTASGVGDSSIPGATVGTASGAAAVSGVGASVSSATGLASGSSSVSGVAEGGEDALGGDDAILIYEEPKKKKKPRRRIEDILEDAVRSVVIKAEKQKPVAKPKPVKAAKAVAPKDDVSLSPAPVDPVEQLRVAEEEAEKVHALLAQYQEQVRRREMEDDEELLMLIAMEML